MTACTHCGTDLPVGLKFCKQCGTPVAATRNEAAGAPCRSCHAVLTPGQRFCNKCGTPVASANDNGAIEIDVPAPPAEPAPQPAYAAAESAHAPAHDIGVESPAANTAPNDTPHVANIADAESDRASAPLTSHGVAATATPNAAADHRGDTVAASYVSPVVTDGQSGLAGASASTEAALAADETVAEPRDVPDTDTAPAPAEPMRPVSGVMPRPIAQPAPTNDDTSARLKIIAAGVAVAVACAGGAFWWHGRQASAPQCPSRSPHPRCRPSRPTPRRTSPEQVPSSPARSLRRRRPTHRRPRRSIRPPPPQPRPRPRRARPSSRMSRRLRCPRRRPRRTRRLHRRTRSRRRRSRNCRTTHPHHPHPPPLRKHRATNRAQHRPCARPRRPTPHHPPSTAC
ncbi:hypothetical protein GPU89_38725 [Burkholderia cepacia]|nr:hypothetical protein [Burkholderia cepacia]